MPAVRRSEERKFWKDLCGFFHGLIEDTKKGGGVLHGVSSETRQEMQSDKKKGILSRIIGRMVNRRRRDTKQDLQKAAQNTKKSREIYEFLKHEMQGPVGVRVAQLIAENSALIRTLPEEWAQYASQYAAREAMKGKRPEEIEAELRKVIPAHITKNLKCIARTECAKANAAIVQARAEACGIQAYIWQCVNDERSRTSHIMMDGVLVFYNDPPNPEKLAGQKSYGNYHAGNTFNCRCFQEPVVDADFLPDEILVHDHGTLTKMTKRQIKKKYGKIA